MMPGGVLVVKVEQGMLITLTLGIPTFDKYANHVHVKWGYSLGQGPSDSIFG